MREGRPSRTAQRVAERRAAHQIVDHPRVFDDPLALAMIGEEAAARLTTAIEESPVARHLRAFMAARSRFAEDELAQAVTRGVRQYVVLGAGLDTFAYRNPYPELRVFEVDHPATQAWKRLRLQEAGISFAAPPAFVPVDFEKDLLAEELCGAGFQPEEPAFFSWLGVTPYLAKDVALATLALIISLSPDNISPNKLSARDFSSRNGVVFDYAVPRSSLNPRLQAAFDALTSRVAAAGEPFQGFFDPAELAAALQAMGFQHLEDLGSEEINSRYFKDRADGLRVGGGLARLMSARG